MSAPRPIAFFDFDGTLLVRESTTLCAVPGITRGLIPPLLGARVVFALIGYKLKLISRAAAHKVAFECYRGRAPDEVERLIGGLHDDIMRHWLSAPVLERLEAHRARGHELAIATASARYFAAPTARDLGIPHVLATELERAGAHYTGHVVGGVLDGERKLERARAFAAERGVSLADCTFYSDHIADLPLLAAVGTPVAVGPHKKLRAEAQRRGWEILEHRRAPAQLPSPA